MSFNPYRKTAETRVPQKVAQKLDPKGKIVTASGKINPKTGVKGERFFDKKGSINAYDKKDALVMINKLLGDSTLGRIKNASYRKQADLPADVRREVILAAFNDPSGHGMKKLGEELLLPIKDVLDYEGWARKILRTRNIGQGEVHRIAKDVKVVAFIVGQDGQSIASQAFGRYVFPSEFKVTAFPEVDIQDIYQMNFDVLEREQDLAKQMIMLKEDQGLIAALDAASTAINDTVYFSSFNIGAFEDIRYQVEKHRLIVDKFIINRQEVSSLIKNMHNYVDPATERELILAGYIGTVLSSQIITAAGTGAQEVVAPGNVYAVTEGTFLGEMGIRLDLQSEAYNKLVSHETKKGWAFLEIVDQAVVNPRAVAKGIQL